MLATLSDVLLLPNESIHSNLFSDDVINFTDFTRLSGSKT